MTVAIWWWQNNVDIPNTTEPLEMVKMVAFVLVYFTTTKSYLIN